MALTQINTDGVKDDAVTAGKIPANAVGSSELADNAVDTAAIADNAVTNAKMADDAVGIAELSATGTASSSTFLRGDNSWTTVNTDLVSDTSPQLGADLDCNQKGILLDDRTSGNIGVIKWGDSGEMWMFHAGSDNTNRIYSSGKEWAIWSGASNDHACLKVTASDTDPAIELYYNNSKKFETTDAGIKVNDRLEFTSGMLYDNTANGNNCGISFNGDGIRPTNGSGSEVDNQRGLGTSSYRWSQLHAVTLYGDGSNLTGLGGRLLSSQQFTSSGTWTKPSGCNMIRVYVTGGGGGGGGSGAGGADFGGAGGAGGTAIEILDVSSLSTVTVTVGSGGAKGSSASSNGSTGGTSSFGSYCSATGGTGGIQGNFGVNKGGNGGTASGGNLNITGGDGGSGQDNSGISNQYASAWGVGGSSYWGGGGGPSSHSGAPENGKAYGSGGGAAHNDNFTAGGNGAAGIVYVEQYS